VDKKAWIHQLKKQVTERGESKASWYVDWIDPSGKRCRKSCGPGRVGKSAAQTLADKIHSELVTGAYLANERVTWDQFYQRYQQHLERYELSSKMAAELSIGTFVRIINPKRMGSIDTSTIDQFIGKRLQETRQRLDANKQPVKVSQATVNRELRYVKQAMRLALDWGFIDKVPRMRFLKPQKKLPTYVTPEDFAAIYQACEVATMPSGIPNVSPADWWRGLLVFLYMTGWRIGQTLELKRDDINLEAGTALTRAESNKGRRDQQIPLHTLVIDHVRPLMASFNTRVFPWDYDNRTLWTEFGRIQATATRQDGKPMPKGGKHGGWYGFHDLRRGFATLNAGTMNLFQLQSLMQHQSLETTKGYVAMSSQLNGVVSGLFVPNIGNASQTG
jgi:integrase